MKTPLSYFIACFERMNCNKRKGETAPHKAVLLLAVIEEVRLGYITNGFIPLSDRMVQAFNCAWKKYVGISPLFNPVFATPFFHLDYEPFWELMKREPFEAQSEYSLLRLRKNFYGAKIPDDLCEYMADEISSLKLKRALLDKYLPNRMHDAHTTIAAESTDKYAADTPTKPSQTTSSHMYA